RLPVDQRPDHPGEGMSALMENLARGFDALPGRDAAGLGPLRQEALASALRDGLPGPRTEAWKYTPLRALDRRSFAPVGQAPAVDAALLADIPAPRLVFVNGRYDASRSDLSRSEEHTSELQSRE